VASAYLLRYKFHCRYDSASEGGVKVDREALDRMVLLRREFYDRICRATLSEIMEESDQVCESRIVTSSSSKDRLKSICGPVSFPLQNKLKALEPMRRFMQWVVEWLDREAALTCS
jgi:hypothetical protein